MSDLRSTKIVYVITSMKYGYLSVSPNCDSVHETELSSTRWEQAFEDVHIVPLSENLV
jgi:hypothetical protein